MNFAAGEIASHVEPSIGGLMNVERIKEAVK